MLGTTKSQLRLDFLEKSKIWLVRINSFPELLSLEIEILFKSASLLPLHHLYYGLAKLFDEKPLMFINEQLPSQFVQTVFNLRKGIRELFGPNGPKFFYHNFLNIPHSQHRPARISRVYKKVFLTFKFLHFWDLRTQQLYTFYEEMIISKKGTWICGRQFTRFSQDSWPS